LFSPDDYKIIGTIAAPNSFSVVNGRIKSASPITSGPDARGYLQARLFNLSVNGMNRGFVTMMYWAEHKNWIGIWRRVGTTATGHKLHSYVVVSNQGVVWPELAALDMGANWNDGQREEHEVLFIASRELIYNTPTLSYLLASLNNQLKYANLSVTENNPANSYWSEYNPGGLIIGNAFELSFTSFGEGAVPKIHNFRITYD
jgi:hypothetical protein